MLALRQSLSATVVRSTATRSMTVLSKQSAEEYKKMDYSKRMSQTGRPVSPHVMIYNFPIGAISSITNRVTGCALSVGLFGLAAAELTSGSALALTQAVGSVPIVAPVAKFSVAFPIVYHYLGALRHFAWDYQPELLETVDVERASYYLFGASGAISVVAMVM